MAASDAKTIREALKAAGYGQKRVGVRNSSYAGGSSVTVTVKDHKADFKQIDKIAHQVERVRYCEHSGEILSGGNMFVFVHWGKEAEAAFAAEHIDAVKATFEKLPSIPQNSSIPIPGTPILMGYGGGKDVNLWHADKSSLQATVWTGNGDLTDVAVRVGMLLANPREW
jgi:hypothetical protein